MGRKVHPIGFRLKVNKTWEGRWYAEGQEYVDQLHQDILLRKMIREETQRAGVSRIEIERFPGKVKITVHTAKPGILIGRKGENVKKIRRSLEDMTGKKIDLEIKEIKSIFAGCSVAIPSTEYSRASNASNIRSIIAPVGWSVCLRIWSSTSSVVWENSAKSSNPMAPAIPFME